MTNNTIQLFGQMDILPLSQTPSSNNDINTTTCKIGSRVSYETQISLTPFNNFEQAVYYISNTTTTPSPYDLYHYKNTQNNTNNRDFQLSLILTDFSCIANDFYCTRDFRVVAWIF